MFNGIVEGMGKVESIVDKGSNKQFTIESPFEAQLGIDQSLAHNGVCLTVEDYWHSKYQVTAIYETLQKSNLGALQAGSLINVERSMTLNSLLDGHLVQGHVDSLGRCETIREQNGSWVFCFQYDSSQAGLLVEKGSITVNGISLTAHDITSETFCVSIIPYTYGHTNLHHLNKGDNVNLEFDLIGKYVQRQSSLFKETSKK